MSAAGDSDVLVRVEGVSKKFCRSLKRSLWYGVQDTAHDLLGRDGRESALRPDEFWAVDDVSFELRRGECLGLIGRNGAGKTTLLKMLNGLIKPDKGRITMRGRVGALIALGAGFNPILTGRENIYVNGSILGLTRREIDAKLDEIINFAEIGDFIDSPVQSYSSGMAVRLGFAVATAMEPDVLLIDEVLAVGDVRFRMKCLNRITSLVASGVGLILVSHSKLDLLRVCQAGLLLNRGRASFAGGIEEALLSYDREALGGPLSNARSRMIEIEEIKIGGSNLSPISSGEPVSVELRVSAREAIDPCRMILHLDSPDVGRLASISSVFGRPYFSVPKGKSVITLSIADLPLLQGLYALNFDFYGREIDSFLGSSGPYELIVNAPALDGFGYGLFHSLYLEIDWSPPRLTKDSTA